MPKRIKDEHAEALKAIKAKQKELKALVAAQSARLERLWLEDRRLPGRTAKNQALRVFLPFEGDNMLGDILAKAFYLMESSDIPS